MENPGFRAVFFGTAGALGGTVAGSLASVVAASVIWSSCFADSCVAPLLPYGAALGALIGLYFGARYGVTSLEAKKRTPSMMDL